jgi:hypothetical protein
MSFYKFCLKVNKKYIFFLNKNKNLFSWAKQVRVCILTESVVLKRISKAAGTCCGCLRDILLECSLKKKLPV